MALKNKFLDRCKDDFISINHKNKYSTIRSLGEVMGIVFEEYNKGRLILLTYAINNKYEDDALLTAAMNKYLNGDVKIKSLGGSIKITSSGAKYIEEKTNELKGHDIKLIDEVIYNTCKFNPSTNSLEDKFDVASDTLKCIYKDKVDYLVALTMFCHMSSDVSNNRNIILQNTNLSYFDEFIKCLKKDYNTDLKIVEIHKRNGDHYSKTLIIDPLALLKKEDGFIINLEGIFKEELPSSLIH